MTWLERCLIGFTLFALGCFAGVAEALTRTTPLIASLSHQVSALSSELHRQEKSR